MNKRNLGNGFGISEIGLGCGNLSYGYGDPIRLLQEAVEHGITFFDTVSFHKNNMAEDVVGDALRFYKSKTLVLPHEPDRVLTPGTYDFLTR